MPRKLLLILGGLILLTVAAVTVLLAWLHENLPPVCDPTFAVWCP